MAVINFGGVDENVVTREEFPLEKAREVLKDEVKAEKHGRRPLPTVGFPVRRFLKSKRLASVPPLSNTCFPMPLKSRFGLASNLI